MNNTILSLPSEWEHESFEMEEVSSTTSSEEASKVFEQWQTDGHHDRDHDELDVMELDDMARDEVMFVDHCPSPTTPLDELGYLSSNFTSGNELDKYSDDFSDPKQSLHYTSSLTFQERYEATLQKLAESMRRSQETRKCLGLRTTQMEHYPRTPHISNIVKSIETSSRQLQGFLNEINIL